MKTFILLTQLFIFLIFSFSAGATTNHLEQAIKHTESAISAINGPVIAEQAEIARIHAVSAKQHANPEVDTKHLENGIGLLEDAVKQGKNSNPEAAKKAALEALDHFIQFEK